jgi:molybdopterin/thiamine biosynthesis adenylyltransferase
MLADLDRYARHRLIPQWDQTRLAGATAVVVGVGALGNEVAKNLALAGVGRLLLCDPDTVSPSNLSRTVLFRAADIGRTKVTAAAGALAGLAPDVTVEARPAELLGGIGLGELADADIVLGCLDSRRARLQLLGRCALVDARLIDGGATVWGGELRIRGTADEPCHACSLSPRERAESDLPASCAAPVGPAPAPSSIASIALVAGWLTLAALRTLVGSPPAPGLWHVDGPAGTTAPVTMARDPDCLYHRPLGPVERTPVGHASTVGDLLAVVPADEEPLAWVAFARPGPCDHCGQPCPAPGFQPGVTRCPRCGQCVRLRTSERLRDAGTTVRLCDLGVPPEEILAVRKRKGDYRWLRLSR